MRLSRRSQLVCATVLLPLAAAVRIVAVEDTTRYRPTYTDSAQYLALSHHISLTGDYGQHTPGHGVRAPGYPYLLAAVDRLAGSTNAPPKDRTQLARGVQVVLGVATVALIGLLAAQLFGAIAGLAATAIATIYIPLIAVGTAILSENLSCRSWSACWRRRSTAAEARRTGSGGRYWQEY